MHAWGKGPLLLVTLLVGADSKTAPGKGPRKKIACMPAYPEGSWGECSLNACLPWPPCLTPTEMQLGHPSQAEQCWEILRPFWAGLALGFLPTAACLLHGWVGLPRQADIRAGSPCPLFDPLGQSEIPSWRTASGALAQSLP